VEWGSVVLDVSLVLTCARTRRTPLDLGFSKKKKV
jgi:hypothetical protein